MMRKTVAFVLLAILMAAPVVAKDKAPKNEKVKNVILIIGDGMGLGATASWMINQNYGPTCFDRALLSRHIPPTVGLPILQLPLQPLPPGTRLTIACSECCRTARSLLA